jgi:hypothetical protein
VVDVPLAEASLMDAPELRLMVLVGFITPASVSTGGGCLKSLDYEQKDWGVGG